MDRKGYQLIRSYRYLTGYHGTTHACARKIEKEGFEPSCAPKNWLGDGIYFYKYYSDAAIWESPKAGPSEEVFHVVVKVKEREYVDLEQTPYLLEQVIDYMTDSGVILPDSPQERQRIALNYFWSFHKEIKAVGGRFPAYKRSPGSRSILTEFRMLRREFCIRSNDIIKQRTCINNVEL